MKSLIASKLYCMGSVIILMYLLFQWMQISRMGESSAHQSRVFADFTGLNTEVTPLIISPPPPVSANEILWKRRWSKEFTAA